MDDYYELLDVAPDAERDDIRSAYRAKRDALTSADGDKNRAEVAKLNRAWNVLSDPAQRDRYDERLAEHRESDESDDDDDDDDDDEDDGDRRFQTYESHAWRTRAEQRAEIRRARAERKPTIVMPEGPDHGADSLAALGPRVRCRGAPVDLPRVSDRRREDHRQPVSPANRPHLRDLRRGQSDRQEDQRRVEEGGRRQHAGRSRREARR